MLSVKNAITVLVPLALLFGCAPAGDPSFDSNGSALAPSGIEHALDVIRSVEDHRLSQDQRLIGYLQTSRDPRVLLAALTAAGHIGDAGYGRFVTPHLRDQEDQSVRAGAAYALQLLGDRSVGATLLQQLSVDSDEEGEGSARAAILRALGVLQVTQSGPIVEHLILTERRGRVHEAAARAWLSLLPTVDPATTSPNPDVLRALLSRAVHGQGRDAVACASALRGAASKWTTLQPWISSDQFLAAAATTEDQTVLYLFVPILPSYPSTATAALRAFLTNPHNSAAVRARTLQFLSDPQDAVTGLKDSSPAVRANALALAAGLTTNAVTSALVAALVHAVTTDPSTWVRSQALGVLAQFQPDAARPLVMQALGSSGILRDAAIGALATLGGPNDVATLYPYLQSADFHVKSVAALAVSALAPAQQPAGAHDVFAHIIQHAGSDPGELPFSVAVALVAQMGWTDLVPSFVALYPHFQSPTVSDVTGFSGRFDILSGIASVNDQGATPLVLQAVGDPLRLVGLEAASTYQTLTGQDLSSQVRLNNLVDDTTPDSDEVESALETRVILSMRQGDVVLRMLPEASVTATKFVRRVRSGFYDGLTFHRVVPGFVAQGGDPEGIGTGGDKKFVRDEVSRFGHRRGTVGIATAGRDTGDSQFFFNLLDNMRLDDNYTVFAEVESGLEIIDDIEVGDVILRAHVVGE